MLSEDKNIKFRELFSKIKIIPVAAFENVDTALKTADFLLSNSHNLLEITLRTEAAFDCIKEISKKFPEIETGAGSVLSEDALKKAIDSGAEFGVAPGLDTELVKFALKKNILFIPGISTPSELNTALKFDLQFIKIFPSAKLGGPDYIKAIIAPFRRKNFFLIPTGGINEDNIESYLKTDRVVACGASYIVDAKLLAQNNFEELNRRIRSIKHLD